MLQPLATPSASLESHSIPREEAGVQFNWKPSIMNARRSIVDRLIQLVRPRLVSSFAPPPTQIAPDLWSLERRLRMPGGPSLPARTTVMRLRSAALLVVSPPPVEAGGLEGLDTLGSVEEVLIPNSFHY